jgi:hypothetical protein
MYGAPPNTDVFGASWIVAVLLARRTSYPADRLTFIARAHYSVLYFWSVKGGQVYSEVNDQKRAICRAFDDNDSTNSCSHSVFTYYTSFSRQVQQQSEQDITKSPLSIPGLLGLPP